MNIDWDVVLKENTQHYSVAMVGRRSNRVWEALLYDHSADSVFPCPLAKIEACDRRTSQR